MKKKRKFILIILVILISSIVSVYSLNLCNAKDILFNPSDNNWNVETIEDALNDLYENKGDNSCSANVAKPNLGDKLIPVTIADDGTVTYADVNTKWYDYCNKIWANAVFLIDNPSKTYQVGNTINEVDIESYFVWIPKYQYKLWNISNTQLTDLSQYNYN